MEKKIKQTILGCLLILTLIFLVVWVIWGYSYYIAPFPNFDIFLASAITNISHSYDVNTFNCQNFSMELQSKLKDDYNVLFVAGFKDDENYYVHHFSEINIEKIISNKPTGNSGAHEWIYLPDYNLYIEAVGGTVIPNKNIYFLK